MFRQAAETLRKHLPSTWTLTFEAQRTAGTSGPDILVIRAPDGVRAVVAAQGKRSVAPVDVPRLVEQLRCSTVADAILIAAPFLSPRTREVLVAHDAGYVDATGNVRLALDRPALLLELSGADSNPWKVDRERPIRSLKGPAAGRVVRALCDFRPPYGVRALAARAASPPSSVSRVVALLDREALVRRAGRGQIAEVEWRGLLRRWVQDYRFVESNRVQAFLEPRGLSALFGKLRAADWRYAVTGSFAASEIAPVAAPRLALIYVDDPHLAGQHLSLVPAERGVNVLLVEPFDSVVFERTWQKDGIGYAALSQVSADLLTGHGREPAEAEALLGWMEQHEDAWRT